MSFDGEFEGDVVDFGPSGAPARRRMAWQSSLPMSTPRWLAILGVVLAAVSLLAPWQKLRGGNASAAIDANLAQTIDRVGGFGFIFLFGLLGLFSLAAVSHLAPARPRKIAALAGLGLSLAMVLIVVALAYRLTTTSYFFDQSATLKFALDWGSYAGAGSVVAFGLSFLTLAPLPRPRPTEPTLEPDAIDLEVRVESV